MSDKDKEEQAKSEGGDTKEMHIHSMQVKCLPQTWQFILAAVPWMTVFYIQEDKSSSQIRNKYRKINICTRGNLWVKNL